MEPKFLVPGSGNPLNVLGDHMTVRLTGEDTGGRFTLVEQTNEPGTGIPMHLHENEDELFHILDGQMEFTVGTQTTTATAGTTVFLPRNIPHNWMTVGETPARTLLSVFPAGAEKMWQELNDLPAGPPDMQRVVEICARHGVKFLPPSD
jgi:quercetin dioxygenase-like cupin family protein